MAKITFLGTAASIPSAQRDNTSFLFFHKKELFLIDCPGAIVQKLKKVSVDYTDVTNVIITHQHPDHFYGLPHLIHAQSRLNKHISIFTNKRTARLLKKMLTLCGLTHKQFPRARFIDVLKSAPFYCRRGLSLKAIPNKHISQSFGLRIGWNNTSLCYSSDTALSPRLIKTACACDYLIHDCTATSSFFNRHSSLSAMHTSAGALARTFKDTHIKKIIPVHFLLENKSEEKNIRRELAPLKEKLLIPKDFQSISV